MQLRRQGSNLPFASNSRASYRWTTPDRNVDDGPGRSRTCTVPIKSRQLCIELQGRVEMWSAGVEPATRRVSDGRSPLSYDHAMGHAGWARLDSNQRHLVCWTSALGRAELLARGCCRGRIRDKGSNLGLHIQSVVSCRLDDPGMSCVCMSRSAEAERCFPCHSPALRPWIARSSKSSVVLRGGDLEPGALASSKFAGKSSGLFSSEFSLREAQRGLSLLGGASSRNCVFSSWASLHCVERDLASKRRRRPAGSPSLSAGCG